MRIKTQNETRTILNPLSIGKRAYAFGRFWIKGVLQDLANAKRIRRYLKRLMQLDSKVQHPLIVYGQSQQGEMILYKRTGRNLLVLVSDKLDPRGLGGLSVNFGISYE